LIERSLESSEVYRPIEAGQSLGLYSTKV